MGDLFMPAPQPKTELGRFRILSSTAGIRVSPLCLGAMSIGTAWRGFMGHLDKEGAFKLLDAFVDAGGNVSFKILYLSNWKPQPDLELVHRHCKQLS
jgi:hypothetical protein